MRLGLIAGSGILPILVADRARGQGQSVAAVAFDGYASQDLAAHVDRIYWIGLAQMGKLIDVLKKEGARHAVMIGGVRKATMYSSLKQLRHPPDLRAMKFWFQQLKDRRDASILGGFMEELAKEGIELVSCLDYLKDHLADAGCMTGRTPTDRETADVHFGARMASEIAGLDVGQSVIVKEGVVTAVEAIEGTDEAIRRGAKLANKDAVLVKFSRPDQDFRYDVPVVGPRTIEICDECGVRVIALQAKRVLMADKPAVIREADRKRITVMGVELSAAREACTDCGRPPALPNSSVGPGVAN